jgi:polysaccharide deacetylase 2 family uncharacterized protein YibQ
MAKPHQNKNAEAAVNGRFFIGVLSGVVLVSGAFVVGSVLFPVDGGAPSVEVANAPDAPAALAPAVEPEPEPAAEPAPAGTEASAAGSAAAPADDADGEAGTEGGTEEVEAPAPTALVDETAEAAAVSEGVTGDSPAPAEAATDQGALSASSEATPAASPGPDAVPAAPMSETKLPAAEPPADPPAVQPVAEAAPEPPALAEAATPPEAPASLDPPAPDTAKAPAAEVTTAPAAEVAETPDAAVAEEPVADVAEAPAEEAAIATAPTEPAALPEPAPESAPESAELAPEAPEATDPPLPQAEGMVPGADQPAMPGTVPDAMPGTEAELPEPEVAALPEAEGAAPSESTFTPAPSLDSNADGVIVGRLPRIGEAAETETPGQDAAETVPEADIRPIVQFAASFENPEAKPVLALVLIDPGTAELDRAGLAALPFQVSFALDPMDPATPERAAIYRAAGKEVVMLATGIAEGAQASDIEVAFQSMAQGLPEAVAVMDLAEPLFQDRRPIASLVVPVVGAQGRGILTWDRGLNAADQVARRDDVPAAVVFRDLGSAGTDSVAIRRVLDRAVFKAGQDGRVAVAGTTSPELVAALLEWTVEGRAATVALAPLTAVLTVE